MRVSGERRLRLAGAGHARSGRWTSTSVKNPDCPDAMNVSELVAPGTVNTMPYGKKLEKQGVPNSSTAGATLGRTVADELGSTVR